MQILIKSSVGSADLSLIIFFFFAHFESFDENTHKITHIRQAFEWKLLKIKAQWSSNNSFICKL
jgi:hypothetical protein